MLVFEPALGRHRCRNCLAAQIEIRSPCGFAAKQKGMNAGVAPLLLSRTGSVSRSPRGETPIVGFTEKPDRDACGRSLRLEGLGFGESVTPRRSVARAARLHTAISAESLVGRRITPIERTELANLRTPFLAGGPRETRVVLGRPERGCHTLLWTTKKRIRCGA